MLGLNLSPNYMKISINHMMGPQMEGLTSINLMHGGGVVGKEIFSLMHDVVPYTTSLLAFLRNPTPSYTLNH